MTDSGFRRSKKGTVFKAETGKRYVFEPGSVSVLVGWPQPVAWKKTRSTRGWMHFRPKICIPRRDPSKRIRELQASTDETGQALFPFCATPLKERARHWHLAWARWYETIPLEIREMVSRFADRQWHILSLLARCGPAAADLVHGNPALAFALASSWIYHHPPVRQPLRSARALLGESKKQRRILAWLGFPATEATRRLLGKVIPKSISVTSLLYLRQSLTDPGMVKTLSHLQRLNAGAIRIATDPDLLAHATPTLVEEISNQRDEDRRPRAAYLLQDSVNMFRVLSPTGRKFPPVRRIWNLSGLHDALIDDLNRARLMNADVAFPPPPVEGTETIVPITSAHDLVEEGRAQHNCVAAYVDRVAIQQRVYIYRILWPERCTLSLVKRRDRWLLGELKRTCNDPPSAHTHRVVGEWLSGHSPDSLLSLTDERTVLGPS